VSSLESGKDFGTAPDGPVGRPIHRFEAEQCREERPRVNRRAGEMRPALPGLALAAAIGPG